MEEMGSQANKIIKADPEPESQTADSIQLSKLGSVLKGLDKGASMIQSHAREAWRAVQAGTYRIDSGALSQRIINEALRPT